MGQNNRPIRKPVQKPLKTVLISRNAYDWQYGGAERFTANLAKSLQANGIRPVVVTRVPELLGQCSAAGITTYRNLWLKNETRRRWMPAYYLLYPILVLQYVYVLLRYRVDVSILGSRDDQIFASLASHLSRKPVIWVDHADMKGITSQPFRFLKKSYYDAMRAAIKIVAVSRAEKLVIQRHLPKSLQTKFVVINNGAMLLPSIPLPKTAGDFVITFVGRLEKDKGVNELIGAAIDLCAHHESLVFWLVGKGTQATTIASRIEAAGLDDRIKLLGHLDNVYDALSSSDLFVYPSHHDASPLAPVEALLAGIPVVTTTVGGIPEVIDESCGLLVEPASQALLTAALETCITNKKVYEGLRAGAKRRGQQFEFGKIVTEQYIPLLHEALNA